MFAALVRNYIWLRPVSVRYNLFGLFTYSSTKQFQLPSIRSISRSISVFMVSYKNVLNIKNYFSLIVSFQFL